MFRKKPKKRDGKGELGARSSLPTNLSDLGYHFTKKNAPVEKDADGNDLPAGKLLHTATKELYAFDRSDPHAAALLGEALTVATSRHLKGLFEHDLGLVPVRLPLDAKDDEPYTTVYTSKGVFEKPEKLLLLVPGSHTLFGIWSRRVLFNDDLYRGSMYSYIERATQEGYSVVVCNSNENFVHSDGRRGPAMLPDSPNTPIPGSESPENHLETVVETFVKKSGTTNVFVVANSYGGHCVVKLLNAHFNNGIKDNFKAICFTDSVHSGESITSNDVKEWFKTLAVNWTLSDKEAGSFVRDRRFACACVSSGTGEYEHSTEKSIDGIFKFFAAMNGDLSGINPIPKDLDLGGESEDEEYGHDASGAWE